MGKRKHFNDYIIENGIGKFFITNKNKETFEIIVDIEDLYRLIELDICWHIKWDGWHYYVKRTEYLNDDSGKHSTKVVYLARWIMNAEEGDIIDHINNETLDNRKENLRNVTVRENAMNRESSNKNNKTGVRNVSFHNGFYIVQLQIDGKNKRVGSFTNSEEANKMAVDLRNKYYTQ